MKVFYHKTFRKNFKKRISHKPNLINKFKERFKLFLQDPSNQFLKDHKLVGRKKDYRAFSITGDIRVVYYVREEIAYFVDVGTHNQVYGK